MAVKASLTANNKFIFVLKNATVVLQPGNVKLMKKDSYKI
jgi:hypothetical protein